MGAVSYWRPLSRQLSFLLFGQFYIHSFWVLAALNAALLFVVGWTLYRATRGMLAPAAALAVALFPLLSEPLRALLVWPSGREYLLAMALLCLCLYGWRRGNGPLAAGSLLLACLSHEVCFALAPFLFVQRAPHAGRGPSAMSMRFWIGGAAALWVALCIFAERQGVHFVDARGTGPSDLGWAGRASAALSALLNLDEVPGPVRVLLQIGFAVVLLSALACLARPKVRSRAFNKLPELAPYLGWAVATLALSVLLPPNWNSWRVSIALLGTGIFLVGMLAQVHAGLAWAVVALRLAGLVASTPAPLTASAMPPPSASGLSLARLTRLQRIVDSTRKTLLAGRPALARGSSVFYLSRIPLTDFGFRGAKAVRAWYGDSTLAWDWIGAAHYPPAPDPVLAWNANSASPAVILDPQAVQAWMEGTNQLQRGSIERADSLLRSAEAAQVHRADAFTSAISRVRARIAVWMGADARADSLNDLDSSLAGPSAEFYLVKAATAFRRRDYSDSEHDLGRCLSLDPGDSEAIALAGRLARVRSRTGTGKPGRPPRRG